MPRKLFQRQLMVILVALGFLTLNPAEMAQISASKNKPQPGFHSVTKVPVGPGGVGANNLTVNSTTNHIYTANSSSQNVTVLDAATRTILTNIPTGGFPQGVAVNESTNRIYVATNDQPGAIIVIDGVTNSVLTSIPVGPSPYRVAVNPVTNRVFVTSDYVITRNEVEVIDGVTNSVIGTVPTQTSPLGICLNPVTDLVYVACQTGVTVLNGTTLAVVANITTPYRPEHIGVNPATNRIYASSPFNDQLLVIDGASQTVTATLPSIAGGNIAVNSATNRVYVARLGSTGVSVLDGATNTVVAVAPVPSAGIGIHSVTGRVFASAGGRLSEVDSATNTEVGQTIIGNTIGALAVHPILGRVYVINETPSTISVLDSRTGALFATLPVPNVPFSLCVNPLTNRLYAATRSSGIYVFDCLTNELLTTITEPINPLPKMAINPVTNLLYLPESTGGLLRVIDCRTNTLIHTITLAVSRAHDVAVDPVTNRIYAMYPGFFYVIDGYSHASIGTIAPPGDKSFTSIAVNPKTNLVYLTNRVGQSYSVSVIDPRSRTQIATIPLSVLPTKIAVNSELNRVYANHSFSSQVTSIDGVTNTVREVVTNLARPVDVAVDPLASQVFVPEAATDTLTILDEGEVNPRHPKVLFFTPNFGAAGTPVTILGKNLGTATSITLNGVPVSFTVQSASQLTMMIPTNGRTGPIVITNPSGSTNGGVFTVIRTK